MCIIAFCAIHSASFSLRTDWKSQTSQSNEDEGVALALIRGILMSSHSARQISFEINPFSKELGRAEPR